MSKRIPIEEIKNRIFRAHGDTISIVESTYTEILAKATVIHKKHGPWNPWVKNILDGHGHPKDSTEKKTQKIEEVKRRLFKMHGEDVTIVEETYKNSRSDATFINKTHGPWDASVKNVVVNGTNHPLTYRIPITEVRKRISDVHGDTITIVEDTYTVINDKASFIDKEHGAFECLVTSAFKGHGHPARTRQKFMKTNLEKYGFPNPMQNKDVSLKAARTQSNSVIKFHWKTGEELVCQASYEPKVVDYLNERKIDFLWQPQTFTLPASAITGKTSTYLPDLFLINENKWVEIKGYMRPKSQIKWDWFLTQFPNSELWDKKKLKEMGIL